MRGPLRNPIFYVGQSMSPLFRPGDEVLLEPCRDHALRKGDVIVFSPPGQDPFIIHRVIEAGPQGIRTRGDRNAQSDPWLLKKGNILGQVIRVRRNGKTRRVPGGLGGFWLSEAVRAFMVARSLFIRMLDPFLMSAFFSGALASCVPERYKPRIVSISRPEGKEYMLVMGRQVVGRRFAGNEFWQIRRRYRPFIARSFFLSSPLPPSAALRVY